MDALEDILRSMRLSGGVFLDAQFTAPWCITSKIGPEDCRPFMPPPPQLIAYHYVVEGELVLDMAGEDPVEAATGTLLVMPRNDVHTLGSERGLRPANADDLLEAPGPDGLARIRCGGGGASSRVLCGFLGSQDSTDPLIASLPPVLKLAFDAGHAGSWIEGSMRYAARELSAGGPGSSSSLAKLSELLFGEAVRAYANALPPGSKGWLAGLRDPYVGRAIALMHGHLARPWTLEDLAGEVGLSRSALAERFTRHLDMSPIRYLNKRRLQRAADRLRRSRTPVAQIAYEVGYDSEAAFSRSFKRAFGSSPVAFRRATAAE